MSWRNKADLPQTTEWQDIFDKRDTGATVLDVYEEANAIREQALELKAKQNHRKDIASRLDTELSDRQLSSDISGFSDLSEDDQAFFEQYKASKRAELDATRTGPFFGRMREIAAQEYKEVVAKGRIVVLLNMVSSQDCRLVNSRLACLAARFPQTLFVSIRAQDCIPGYPESLCPTVILYIDGQVKKQLVGIAQLGGRNAREADLEWILHTHKVINSDLKADPAPRPVNLAGFMND